ncbi:MAG: hypothetical protein HY290_31110 [Planctomycetia bacterium]|nr:hypothetical protein [Planctomycetia bacterium]
MDADPTPETVKVESVLYGDLLTVGETIDVEGKLDPYVSTTGSYLYFAHATKESASGKILPIQRRWPDSEASVVEATLSRRNMFPVRDVKQEIRLSGSVADAISLMSVELEAGRTLAARRLVSDSEATLPEVAGFVETHLFNRVGGDLVSYDQQMNVIRALGIMDQHRTDGEVVRLIRLMLDKIQAGAENSRSFDKTEKKKIRRLRLSPRYQSSVGNQSLLWLLMTLDEHDAARLFGERLLKLRALASYGWLEEIQEYLDLSHLEDILDLEAVQKRMLEIKPVAWSAAADKDAANPVGHLASIMHVTFEDDGTRLRTISKDGVTCEWNPNTGAELVRTIGEQPVAREKTDPPRPKSGRKLEYGETEFRSEDQQRWYLFKVTDFGGKYGPPQAISIAVSDVSKSKGANGPLRKLGVIEPQWGQYDPFGLVPDREHLHFGTEVFRRDDLRPVSAVNVAGTIRRLEFSADGSRYLLETFETGAPADRRLERGGGRRNTVVSRVRVYDTISGHLDLAVEFRGTKSAYALSRDGHRLAIADDQNAIQVWPIPGP